MEKYKQRSNMDGFLQKKVPKSRSARTETSLKTTQNNYPLYSQAVSQNSSLPHQKIKTRAWKKYVLRGSLVIVALALITGGWLGYKFYRNVAKITHNNNPFNLISAFHPVPLKNQNNQVNILIAADSADRQDGGGGGDLTDSIMLLSVNTQTHAAEMISIPRDLWVNIPSLSHQKINAANTVNNFNESGYPKGGMGQLEKVINDKLGVPIHYYALINYTAFQDLVNAIGGINVNIQSTDPRGLYDPSPDPVSHSKLLKLPNGQVTLNGQGALALARARGENPYSYGFSASDFDRTLHQRWMTLAIKEKVTSSSVLSNPLKIGELADAIGNNVKTDLQLNEIETLYSLTKDINNQSIKSYNINSLLPGKNLLKNYITPEGQEALIPSTGVDDFKQIQTALSNVLSTNPAPQEAVASVVVLNGTKVSGIATKNADSLTKQGLSVVTSANAPKLYSATTIIDNSKGQLSKAKELLQSQFGNNITTDTTLSTLYPDANFIVVIGADKSQ